MNDDKMAAANIGVNLSTQLISIALAIIGLIGTHFVFAQDKKLLSIAYYFLVGASILIFILSVVAGGKGINLVRSNGFNSVWNLQCTKKYFNVQALLLLIGVFSFGLAVLTSSFSKDKSDSQIQILTDSISSAASRNAALTARLNTLDSSVRRLQNETLDLHMHIPDSIHAIANNRGNFNMVPATHK